MMSVKWSAWFAIDRKARPTARDIEIFERGMEGVLASRLVDAPDDGPPHFEPYVQWPALAASLRASLEAARARAA